MCLVVVTRVRILEIDILKGTVASLFPTTLTEGKEGYARVSPFLRRTFPSPARFLREIGPLPRDSYAIFHSRVKPPETVQAPGFGRMMNL